MPFSHVVGIVMVVEDDPDQARLIVDGICERFPNVKASVCCDLDTALGFALEYAQVPCPPEMCLHFVLLDPTHPMLDGGDFIRRFRDDPRLITVPLVGFGKDPGDDRILHLLRQGLSSFVVRPTDPEEIKEVVQNTSLYWLTVNLGVRALGR